MNFKNWLLSEEQIFNEDFKTQREKFIQQSIEPDIVDSYLKDFKTIKEKKYKQINDPIHGLEHIKDRINIDAYKTFHELASLVDYVRGQTDVSGKTNYKNIEVDATPIHEDNDLIIYYADTPQACVSYKGDVPYSWCIARTDASNLFYFYRLGELEPSFYFVKNKERTNKELETFKGKTFTDKYHFFVIQVIKNSNPEDEDNQQYIVTSAENDGDEKMSWNDILKLEPKLINQQKIFVSKLLAPKEKELYKRFSKGISDKEFENLPFDEKDMYLSIYVRENRPLTDNQFKNLPYELKNKYLGFGTGLSYEQFKMIDSDSKLYKRYEDVTRIKVKKTIGTDKFNLMPTEIIVIKKIASEIDFDKLSGFNLESLLGRESENQKDEMAELIIKYKSELSEKETDDLVLYAKDKDKIAELIIQKKPDLSKKSLNDMINKVKDKDKIAELLKYDISKLDPITFLNLVYHANDKNKMAELIIQNNQKISGRNASGLIEYAKDKDKIAELLKDNINNFSDEDIKSFVFYNVTDLQQRVIIKYKKDLSNNDVANLLLAADYNYRFDIAKLLGTANISKLDGRNLTRIFFDSKKDEYDDDLIQIAIIIDRYHTNERIVKRFTSNFEHFLDKKPPE